MIPTFLNLILAILLLGHVSATPSVLQKRSSCAQDNCYRQLIHSSASAAKYCSSYLGGNTYAPDTTITTITTVTTTTSVPLYMYTSLTLIEKRGVDRLEPAAPSATPPPESHVAQQLVERAAMTTTTSPSWSPSSCTAAPTAVSSGCGCFFEASFVTSTQTTTVTKELPVPTQCDAAHNYGTDTEGFGILDQGGEYQHYYSFDIDGLPGGCCARCWGTPGCVAFGQYQSQQGKPNSNYCLMWVLFNGQPQPQNSQCPSGSVGVSLGSPQATPYFSGLGPCGYGSQ